MNQIKIRHIGVVFMFLFLIFTAGCLGSVEKPKTIKQQASTESAAPVPQLFVGEKRTFIPERIHSIDVSKKSFLIKLESPTGITETGFRVIPETVIKKENELLKFDNLSVNDVVWVRAIEESENKYLAEHIIITNDWRSSKVIIKEINASQNKITAEVFLPPHRRGESIVLTLIPETEIKKGKPEEGENRKIVGIEVVVIRDIADVFEIGFGVQVADDRGPFYVTEMDIISPYYCQPSLQPPGCIEKSKP